MRPIYQQDSHTLQALPPSGHAGLWFERFFDRFDSNWDIQASSKKAWIDTVKDLHGDGTRLTQHAERLQQLARTVHGEYREFKTTSAFVTGMGLSHPVENGMSWHRTLGLPYLAGSGVKGLLRAWVDKWMECNEEERQRILTCWFGQAKNSNASKKPESQEAEKSDPCAGELVFFDLLPVAPLSLGCEIMTPHMGDWYEQGASIESAADYAAKAPADWHSPVPVPFLVVQPGARFATLIGARTTAAQPEVERALNALAEALEWLGAGAKTATGYGRMQDEKTEMRHKQEAIQRQQAACAEEWQGVRIKYNRNSGALSVEKPGKTASATRERSAALLQSFPADMRKKIEQNQCFAKANARVAEHDLLDVWL